jgi:hypothetical protein
MAISVENRFSESIELSAGEVTGALGDSITALPVVVALSMLTGVSLPHVLVLFGVFQVVWGIRYGLPLSVEPMKALCGLAIVGVLTYAELAAAGLIAGVVLLGLGGTGMLTHVERWIGTPVIRGVQLAVALLLARSGVDLVLRDPALAAIGAFVALAVAAAGYRRASALCVLALGTGMALYWTGLPTPTLPALSIFPSGIPTVTKGALSGTAAQLAMTVGNAAMATSLLLSDLFDADVSVDDLAESMGAMNLFAVPLGGVPMCHGSGGLAGKHAFGARTAGANLVLGALYICAALVAGVFHAFPMAPLGVLLVLVAIQLGRLALQEDQRALCVGIGLLGFVTNVGVAFLAGMTGYWLVNHVRSDGPDPRE